MFSSKSQKNCHPERPDAQREGVEGSAVAFSALQLHAYLLPCRRSNEMYYSAMAIPNEETMRYTDFAIQLAKDIGAIYVPPETVLWHYTNGNALISILDSMSIYSTQLSCLNDASELRYGSKLYRDALEAMRAEYSGDDMGSRLLDGALEYFKEDEGAPFQTAVPHFIAAFSEERDDLSQWRAYGGGENGYAIAFRAGDIWGCVNSIVARVVYDQAIHRAAARKSVAGMIEFFLDGVRKYSPADPAEFGRQFFEAWDSAITTLAPMIKDPGFSKERECRIIKGFAIDDMPSLKFLQKNNLMSRHLPLQPPLKNGDIPYRLPIIEVMVGPCRNPHVSKVSVDTLLRQKGYPSGLVSVSKIPFQIT